MIANFEYKGLWFLPSNDKDKVAGIVKFEVKKGITLDLIGSFPRDSKTKEIIWGILDDGRNVTLFNNFQSSKSFSLPGFEIEEIESWEENNEIWRRLKVKWPKDIHTHSKEQILYIDKEGLIKRLDYKVEVAGNVLCAHYLSDYQNIAGIKMATKRVVYLLGKNNKPKFRIS